MKTNMVKQRNSEKRNVNRQVIIIGAGPAGIACAVQLKRQGIEPMIIEKNEIGGLILNANKIENYTGFPNGISGIQIAKLLKKHLEHWTIEIVYDNVVGVNFGKDGLYEIDCEYGLYNSEFLVIATGTKPKEVDFYIPENCMDKIFYEVYPLLNTKNKQITIVGSGDAAFDYALSLANNNQVRILNRTDKIKALNLLVEESRKIINIQYYQNAIITEINEIGDKLQVTGSRNKKRYKDESDYLIFAIGREPNLDILSSLIQSRKNLLLKSKKLFLIGDVKNEKYRQLSIAVGNGVKAAMEIQDSLKV
ncbi:MAG: NAD(P)/FAD-dependent oxidoreductase [bacterium]